MNTKILLPAILLANDLLDGDVVFWTGAGWSRDPAESLVARSPEQAQGLDEAARAATAANRVVDVIGPH